LPELPEAWAEALGEPVWRLEWLARDGTVRTMETPAAPQAVELYDALGSYMLAWPCWPEKGIEAGEVYPAGGVFPVDAQGSSFELSWRGGVDAFFWKSLACEGSEKYSVFKFNWWKFREMWEESTLDDEVLADPWLVDWKDLAHKTAILGFDKRRIAAEYRVYKSHTGNDFSGVWLSPSSFAEPIVVAEGAPLRLPIVQKTAILFSDRGIIKYWQKEAVLKLFE
jgi:hypothetical protein